MLFYIHVQGGNYLMMSQTYFGFNAKIGLFLFERGQKNEDSQSYQ